MGTFDDSVVLDTKGRAWLSQAVLDVKRKTRPHHPLFPYSHNQFVNLVHSAATHLGLETWNIVPHVFRHSGPSHDFFARLRDLPTIKRRGRWMSDRSVRRYEKSAQLMGRLRTINNARLEFILHCEREMVAVLEGTSRNPCTHAGVRFRKANRAS